jgi:hypothetical protein
MKTTLTFRNKIIGSAAVFASIALMALPSSAVPQLKGGEVLVKLTRSHLTTTAPAKVAGEKLAMTCPMCKDHYLSVEQASGKMGRRENATVVRHDCKTCENRLAVTGQGKAKKEIAVHVCGEVGNTSCATAKN